MNKEQEIRSFEYVILIKGTPEKIWEALISNEFIHYYWFGRVNTSFWKTGTKIESHSPDGVLEWEGNILKCDPPHLLSYDFHTIGSTEPPTLVTFTIESLGTRLKGAQGEATHVTVVHEGFPIESEIFEGIKEGWPAILCGLKTLLETGSPLGITWREP